MASDSRSAARVLRERVEAQRERDAASMEDEAREWAEKFKDNDFGWAGHADELDEGADFIFALLSEIDYFRTRMMVAVTFLDAETYNKFRKHVAEIDAKHKEESRV